MAAQVETFRHPTEPLVLRIQDRIQGKHELNRNS